MAGLTGQDQFRQEGSQLWELIKSMMPQVAPPQFHPEEAGNARPTSAQPPIDPVALAKAQAAMIPFINSLKGQSNEHMVGGLAHMGYAPPAPPPVIPRFFPEDTSYAPGSAAARARDPMSMQNPVMPGVIPGSAAGIQPPVPPVGAVAAPIPSPVAPAYEGDGGFHQVQPSPAPVYDGGFHRTPPMGAAGLPADPAKRSTMDALMKALGAIQPPEMPPAPHVATPPPPGKPGTANGDLLKAMLVAGFSGGGGGQQQPNLTQLMARSF